MKNTISPGLKALDPPFAGRRRGSLFKAGLKKTFKQIPHLKNITDQHLKDALLMARLTVSLPKIGYDIVSEMTGEASDIAGNLLAGNLQTMDGKPAFQSLNTTIRSAQLMGKMMEHGNYLNAMRIPFLLVYDISITPVKEYFSNGWEKSGLRTMFKAAGAMGSFAFYVPGIIVRQVANELPGDLSFSFQRWLTYKLQKTFLG